jgi:hypothetical protein
MEGYAMIRIGSRICDICGKEKELFRGKTCENGHFSCRVCGARTSCRLCGKKLK